MTEAAFTAAIDSAPSDALPADIATSALPVALYGFVQARPGYERKLRDLIASLLTRIRSDPGHEQYAVHSTGEDPARLMFYERWASGPHLVAHLSQPYMRKYLQDVADLTVGDAEVHYVQPICA